MVVQKILCWHLICIFIFCYIFYSVIHMKVFTCCSKGLLYGSSPLINLRKDTLFKNGFRPNFLLWPKQSFKSIKTHREILLFSFWNMERKQIGNMLPKCSAAKYLIQSTWVQAIQTSNLINTFPSSWQLLREGQGFVLPQNLQSQGCGSIRIAHWPTW